jgi:para-nitrobenzyl esterase
MSLARRLALLAAACLIAGPALAQTAPDRVTVETGVLEGLGRQASGVRIFRGVPYASPPLGALRWREPQPAARWDGVRPAKSFGPQCMQQRIFDDMVFRARSVSEDCLYLNVWTPAKAAGERLPVLVYFYGGGFRAGDGSEPRYDGEAMAAKGMVVVTLNYRLGVFGFFSHPELSAETPHKASGNQGLADQAAALRWVRANIAAFGGDPTRVTIAGESAGSYSVSAQMASPLSKGLIAGAIAESGSLLGVQPMGALAQAEQAGKAFGEKIGAPTLADLRAKAASEVLTAGADWSARPVVDGWFFPRQPREIFAAGEQARVPLLVGSNTEEGSADWVLGKHPKTVAGWRAAVQERYGAKAPAILAAYPATTDAEAVIAARDLASDAFIGHTTWALFDQHRKSGAPTWYYLYARPRPATKAAPDAPRPSGAVHSAEIEYAMGNLDLNPVYAWEPADRETSRLMQGWFANFVKQGDPNGVGLPAWPAAGRGKAYGRMVIDAKSRVERGSTDARMEAYRSAAQP